jgi:hypothetical protein
MSDRLLVRSPELPSRPLTSTSTAGPPGLLPVGGTPVTSERPGEMKTARYSVPRDTWHLPRTDVNGPV